MIITDVKRARGPLAGPSTAGPEATTNSGLTSSSGHTVWRRPQPPSPAAAAPAKPGTLVLKANSAWNGVALSHFLPQPFETALAHLPRHLILLFLSEPGIVEAKIANHPAQTLLLKTHQIVILPAETRVTMRTQNTGELLAVTIDPRFLCCAAHEIVRPAEFELEARFGIDDPMLRASILALHDELQTGTPGGSAYAESVGSAIAVHLARHYANRAPAPRKATGGLSRPLLARVLDHIQAHLAEDISLEALAGVAGLSVFHFARQFKISTGLAPHRFIIHKRVERAKELLLQSHLTLAEVALQVGFCDQSHFTTHFRRIYHLTPKAFLRKMGTTQPPSLTTPCAA